MDILLNSIQDIYRDVFGVSAKALKAWAGAAEGTIVQCPLTLSYDGDEYYNPDSYTLPFEPLITVDLNNVVIRNPILMNRQNGTVKEMWSASDYDIEIKGIVSVADRLKLPEAEINRIRWFGEVRRAIEVKSPYLSLFGIQYMAIEHISFPPTVGYNYQAYVIKGYSDKIFDL